LKRGPTGRYLIKTAMDEKIRIFIPNPLPPEPPLYLSSGRGQLLEQAILALGRLDSISLLLPEPDIFLYSYIRREAVISSQIEGTQSSLSDLLLFELNEYPGSPIKDVTEVSNYVSALEHGLKRLGEGFPFSNRLIREMHEILLAKGRGSEKSPGEFRITQNWIGGTRPGNAHFVPPPPEEVPECMSSLEKFIHDKNIPYPSLIKAGLAHVQFETIHPFLDGNGRIGRLLIAFILHHEGILQKPLLYLSLYFKQNRNEYYRLLDTVRQEGDWESWIDFFLTGVIDTANNAVETAQHLLILFKEDTQKIKSIGRKADTALRIFNIFCERSILNVAELCKKTGLSFPSVGKGINTLLQLGIIGEITGKKRNRIYVYKEYLDILNKGTEYL